MDNMIQTGQYRDIIKKIKTKRLIAAIINSGIIIVWAFINIITMFKYTSGSLIMIFLPPLAVIMNWIAVQIIFMPIPRSLTEQADPQKYLALSTAFKVKDMDSVCCLAYFYMGNFLGAKYYSEKLSQSKKAKIKLSGLFNKACCEFFLNDIEAFKKTAMQFKYAVANEKMRKKHRKLFENNVKYLDLMAAFSENNTEQIALCQNLVSTTKSKVSQGLTNYLRGIAAYILGDREKAIYYFVAVKTECPKTFFPPLCDQYLEKLK